MEFQFWLQYLMQCMPYHYCHHLSFSVWLTVVEYSRTQVPYIERMQPELPVDCVYGTVNRQRCLWMAVSLSSACACDSTVILNGWLIRSNSLLAYQSVGIITSESTLRGAASYPQTTKSHAPARRRPLTSIGFKLRRGKNSNLALTQLASQLSGI